VSGTFVAFHQRIQVLSRGSPSSGRTVPPGSRASGHVIATASAEYPRNAASRTMEDRVRASDGDISACSF
jgi:hypothetical protein